MGRVHVIITTHTTRHLRRTLLGIASLRRRPDSVVVSCDNDRLDVRELVSACSAEFRGGFAEGILLVQRPHLGTSAQSQVRNNGVRAVLPWADLRHDRLLFLDGDCCPAGDWSERHLESLDRAALSIGFRFDLSAAQTESFSEDAVREGRPPATTEQQETELELRARRYSRALRLRRMGLTWFVKPHKPKVLSANFGVTLHAYSAINGFDELYRGYGQEDDDFSRRLYRAGFDAEVGVNTAIVYHQWHETRAPRAWADGDGVARFRSPWEARCARGLETPVEQPDCRTERFIEGRAVKQAEPPASVVA